MSDDEELEEVSGYIYTHVDCPNCNEPVEFEGDRSSENVICDACGFEFRIGLVR